MLSDTELVEALKGKKPAAFEQLITQHGAMLYRTASRIVGGEEAEEVVQEALLTVYQKIQTFNGQAALATWLYRILVHAALMRLRIRARLREKPVDFGDTQFTAAREFNWAVTAWDLSPENTLLRQEARTVLREGINRLPKTYREVYALGEVEGRPYEEVATILQINAGAVKTRLHRARLFLREMLEHYFAERLENHGR